MAVVLAVAIVLPAVAFAAFAPAPPPNAVSPWPSPPAVDFGSPSGPMSDTNRDCGFSVVLTGGRSLFVFCDSGDIAPDQSITWFANNTAGFVYDSKPTVVRDFLWGDKPLPFIWAHPDNYPCTGALAGRSHVIWPKSATVVPGGAGRDRVLVFFSNLCYDESGTIEGHVPVSTGVAEFYVDHDDPSPHTAPIVATVIESDLWSDPADGHGAFGEASIYVPGTLTSNSWIYVYRCGVFYGCEIGRVLPGAVGNPSSYRYFDGSAWVAAQPSAPTVELIGDAAPRVAFNVIWIPEMGVWAMGYTAFPGGYVPDVRVRFAASVEGPWSAPITVLDSADCEQPVGCYAGYVHQSLSGIDFVGVTLFDPNHAHAFSGRHRLVQQRVDLEPAPAGVCRSGFSDVWSDHLFCEEIGWAADEEITEGWPNGSYRPTMEITRRAVAAWMYRLSGSPPGPFDDPGYTDVEPSDPFATEIFWSSSEGVATGRLDGSFGPTDVVTRGAVAAWFYRLADSPTFTPPTVPTFSDVGTGSTFFKEIEWASAEGIVFGYPPGTFEPGDPVSRQVMATLTQRFSETL